MILVCGSFTVSILRLIKRQLSCRLTLVTSKLVPEPSQLSSSDCRHERDLRRSLVDFDVGDFVESLDAKFYAVTACFKSIDAFLIGWLDDQTLTAIHEDG